LSVLGRVAAGGVLEPKPKKTSRCQWSYEEILERVYRGLLPSQREFVECDDKKLVGFVGGFGSGKTRALASKVLKLCLDNPGKIGAVFEPTNQMVRDVWCKSFDDFLEEMGIEHDFRISPQPEYVIHLPNGTATILCRSTETFNRIRGTSLAWACADEIDTSPKEVADQAVNMMLARLRGGTNPQLALSTTPEGYKTTYRLFVEEGDKPDRKLIQAKTTDNPHLPEGFIESLYANYPPQLLASYLEGEFTNLAAQTCYHVFDRDRHWCDTKIQAEDTIYVGADFNVGACFCELVVRRGDQFHVVAEHWPKDTPALIRKLQETYPLHHRAGQITIVPDASSRHRTTSNAAQSDLALLRKGGFRLKEQSANPQIQDRINSINSLLIAGRLKVNHGCKYLLRSLEQQAFDKGGKPEKGIGGLDDISGPVDALGYCISNLAPLRRWTTGRTNKRNW